MSLVKGPYPLSSRLHRACIVCVKLCEGEASGRMRTPTVRFRLSVYHNGFHLAAKTVRSSTFCNKFDARSACKHTESRVGELGA